MAARSPSSDSSVTSCTRSASTGTASKSFLAKFVDASGKTIESPALLCRRKRSISVHRHEPLQFLEPILDDDDLRRGAQKIVTLALPWLKNRLNS